LNEDVHTSKIDDSLRSKTFNLPLVV